MKAYEFSAKVASDGRLELPEIHLEELPNDPVVRVIVLVEEGDDRAIEQEEEDLEFSPESFKKSWNQVLESGNEWGNDPFVPNVEC